MHKLVRDKIPKIVKNKKRFRTASKSEYKKLLAKKLVEEAKEFLEAESLEELADVCEVIKAIQEAYGFKSPILNQVRAKKRAGRV